MTSDPTLRVECATGAAIARHLDALAALRISVFREYPYLYDGSLDYEREYLASYASSPASLVVVASDGDRVVGASTAMPLTLHSDDVVPPLTRAGFDPATVYYFGESVLEPAYRGRGLGSRFFLERERRARELGVAVATFCAVERPADHPRRPPGYVAPGALWRRHGFERRSDIVGTFAWRDVGEAEDTAKPMVFWTKPLA
ncbi:MAG TPA: GNAT family N-acetyltransferase [Kofleriaceae bacterium]|jgi:GNAT superfamily N-acetyltransferase|nr:GNAT family N-acetyltransferase [Kofleriaceae bacterium]